VEISSNIRGLCYEKDSKGESIKLTDRLIRTLHVLDMAGIGSIISHYQNEFGHKSQIIYRHKKDFGSKISAFYGGIGLSQFRSVIFRACVEAKNYDIIHIHSAESLVPLFKLLHKKVILHYHGSDINDKGRSKNKIKILQRSMADAIVYNTSDMLPKIITINNTPKFHLINPIDTKLFHQYNIPKNGSLAFISKNLDKEKTTELIKRYGDVKIIDIDDSPISYTKMPLILSKFTYFIDDKITDHGMIAPLSSTALQALACGCIVYRNMQKIDKMPETCTPEFVVKRLDEIYKSVLDNKSELSVNRNHRLS